MYSLSKHNFGIISIMTNICHCHRCGCFQGHRLFWLANAFPSGCPMKLHRQNHATCWKIHSCFWEIHIMICKKSTPVPVQATKWSAPKIVEQPVFVRKLKTPDLLSLRENTETNVYWDRNKYSFESWKQISELLSNTMCFLGMAWKWSLLACFLTT